MTRHQRNHLAVQIARRCVQLGTVALLAGLVFLSLYAHYWAAKALDDVGAMAGVTGAALAQIDRFVSTLDRPEAFLDGFKGTLWSMRLAGFDISDPLAALELLAAAKTLHLPLLVSVLLPALATVLLGRVFCSWICPGYLLFEVAGKARKLLRLAELPPPAVRFSHGNKYIFLGVGLAVAALTSRPLFALLYPPAVISRLLHAWIFGTALTGILVLLGTVLVVEVAVAPRWFCRSLCPGGALLGILGAPRLLRVRLDAGRCTGCGQCGPVCEEGLDPVRECAGMECDNCGECVRHCPEEALAYRVGWPRRAARPRTVLLPWVVIALVLGAAGAVRAHHILGLPHYSYKENYPQVPTLEYPAVTGPYDVLLTSYPGKPAPGDSANLAFYIKDRNDGAPYAFPVELRVLQTFTFGRNRELLPRTRLEPFDQVHKHTVLFDREGEYVVELSLEVEGQTEVIPFLMVVGNPSSAWSVVAAVGTFLAVFLVVVRAIRIKRQRRRHATRCPTVGA